ncbi:MAG: hypothetical protein QOJ09_33 [Actinomycetota bacterium]|jgi:hypothetical protein|nr:hypothetical protein [Actinomycetota bacterium]
MQKIRTRGNKWIIAAGTLLVLIQTAGAGLKWG